MEGVEEPTLKLVGLVPELGLVQGLTGWEESGPPILGGCAAVVPPPTSKDECVYVEGEGKQEYFEMLLVGLVGLEVVLFSSSKSRSLGAGIEVPSVRE